MPESFLAALDGAWRPHNLAEAARPHPRVRPPIPDSVNASRSFHDASRMNWVTGARGVTLEKIEFHERLAPSGVDL